MGYGFGDVDNRVIGGNIGAMNRTMLMGTGGGASAAGAAGAGGGTSIADILNTQKAENQWAKDKTEAGWQEGKGYLAQSQGLASKLMAQPEALNDQVVQQMLNKQRAQVDAQANAQLAQGQQQLAASGQLSTGNLQALNDRIARQRIAGITQAQTDVGIQRANQRNSDIINAATLGMNTANTFLQNTPQYQPDDYSGYAALANQGGGGYARSYGAGLSGSGGRKVKVSGGQMPGTFGFTGFNQVGPASPGQLNPVTKTASAWSPLTPNKPIATNPMAGGAGRLLGQQGLGAAVGRRY